MEEKGFTLIELIVVMAVFLLIIGTALAIFISIVQHQRRILAQQELLNQASYLIEYMTKGLRMAAPDSDGSCLGGQGYVYLLQDYDINNNVWKGIKFINASDDYACQKFCLDNSDAQNPVVKEIRNGGSSGNNWDCDSGTPVTTAKIKTNFLNFSVNGNSPKDPSYAHAPLSEEDSVQPRVTIFMSAKHQGDDSQPETKIQTTVSERDLNK